MHKLAERLLKAIRKEQSIRAGDRLAAAVSGGADSVALLCLLLELRAELGIVLSVAHVNHKLRGEESDEEERFVGELAWRHGLELHVGVAPVKCKNPLGGGSTRSSGIEATARELRYGFFRHLAREGRLNRIATAHTLDDQAETVLLRIFRGTGIRGLSGIHPRIALEERGSEFGAVVRPLLGFRRRALQQYLTEREQSWKEDSSNLDVGFLRNRVRHRLLPTIEQEFGDSAIEHMAELAEIARGEEEHWQAGHPEVGAGNEAVPEGGQPGASSPLAIGPLLTFSVATQRRLVRRWLEENVRDLGITFPLIEDVLELAHGATGKRMELPGGRKFARRSLRRAASEICLEQETLAGGAPAKIDFEYVLAIPGSIEIPELDTCFEAIVMRTSEVPSDQQEQLLDLERTPRQVVIRNWRAGDRYWPSHTAAAKKVKDLLSDRHATGVEKKMWPVAAADACGLIWMRGFAVPAAFCPRSGSSRAIWIRETGS